MHEGKGPKGYRRSDERIKEEASEILYWDNEVDATDIEVEVLEGVIYLEGKVDSRHAKRAAEIALENITGLHDIQNNLTIKETLDIHSDKIIARGYNGLYSQEETPR